MIVVFKPDATPEQVEQILAKAAELGLKTNVSEGVERTIVGLIGPEDVLQVTPLAAFEGVEKVIPVLAPYRLVSREYQPEDSVVDINDHIRIGGSRLHVIAGPCSVEGEERLMEVAAKVKAAGATLLRGGAFKPRTSPYDFQGLGEEGLKILQKAGKEYQLATVSEVMDPRDVELMCGYVDVLQVGARNMQNFSLLKELGKVDKPVLLKRGISATIKEWLMSAEYILANGNFRVIFCERGIRTFETATRNTLDINAVSVVKQLSHLPVLVDPSHATGRWGLVAPAARASIAAGCDGLMIEVHQNPKTALSDGVQSLVPENFETLMRELQPLAHAVQREL
ncbi:MAG: 3-deoxy-7-phosphoheptulonate synthase [Candidatus Omnitrophica bacterium]|nr:3-deoxy-7-phosphoheptulonate synthase [Candidatus Omnitrophota bacterium]MCB9721179.1 3-deoxy-7-phosphoheptulonate synthase [Candidatus Omnitrophota bacterium]